MSTAQVPRSPVFFTLPVQALRAAALCFLFTAGSPLRAAPVEATGQAVVVRGNQPSASAQAQAQAVRAAIEKVVVAQGGPREGADGTVDANVYARAASLITSSSVVSERVDGNILVVTLAVEVNTDAVRQGIGERRATGQAAAAAAPPDLGRRRILILATEQLGPEQIISWVDVAIRPGTLLQPGAMQTKRNFARVVNEMGTLSATLADGFTAAGFNVIDPEVLRGKLRAMPRFEPLNLTDDQARSVAKAADADAVIIVKGVGKLTHASSLLGPGMFSGQANVVARLVRVKDGKVLASSSQHSAQVHIDQDTARLNALTEAARLTSAELVGRLRPR
jgi:hypothetical protein